MRHSFAGGCCLLLALLLSPPAAFAQPALETVIVSFEGDQPLTPAHYTRLTDLGLTLRHTMVALPMVGVDATPAQLQHLKTWPDVRSIRPNQALSGELHQAVVVSGVAAARDEPVFVALNGGRRMTGRGITVLVNDSGFDGTHPDHVFGPRIVQNAKASADIVPPGEARWIESGNTAQDDPLQADTDPGGGHGTHVMGIVGGDASVPGSPYEGVAPEADLIGYSSGVTLTLLDVAGGFDYALFHRKDYNIRVLSNSWGNTDDKGTDFDPDDPISIATKLLADQGVIVVYSAGNSGLEGQGSITGNFKKAPWVITVANGDKNGLLNGTSSFGRTTDGNPSSPTLGGTVVVDGETFTWEDRPTLTAPGTSIVSTKATASGIGPLSALDDINLSPEHRPFYTHITGSSMAAPHVAGIAALMLEADPTLTWREIKPILESTVTPMPDTFPWEAGAGYVNAHAAVAAAFGLDPTPYLRTNFDPIEQPLCTTPTTLTDASGDALVVGADATAALSMNETATDFEIALEVADLALAPPGTGTVGGGPVGFVDYYDVHFILNRAGIPAVAYIASGAQTTLDGTIFRLCARSADGTTAPNCFDTLAGTWTTNPDNSGTLTWTLPKAKLNVSAVPLTTSVPVARDAPAAGIGDRLQNWSVYVYQRTGFTTPDRAGIYSDQGQGSCYVALNQ